MAMLIGLIDGDGHISLSKEGLFLRIHLIKKLNIRDIELLEYIFGILQIGTLRVSKVNTIVWTIGKTELQDVFTPLICHYKLSFLTYIRSVQFKKAMYVILNNISKHSNLPYFISYVFSKRTFNTPIEYTHITFFLNSIIGFTLSEGSFFEKSDGTSGLAFSQKDLKCITLFKSFNLVFKSNKKIFISRGKLQFELSSKKDGQSLIPFFSFSGLHPLIRHKGNPYSKWISSLRNNKRYSSLIFPS